MHQQQEQNQNCPAFLCMSNEDYRASPRTAERMKHEDSCLTGKACVFVCVCESEREMELSAVCPAGGNKSEQPGDETLMTKPKQTHSFQSYHSHLSFRLI